MNKCQYKPKGMKIQALNTGPGSLFETVGPRTAPAFNFEQNGNEDFNLHEILLSMTNTTAKEYLKDLYNNTPIFDEVAKFAPNQNSHWNKIAFYLLSTTPGEKEHLINFIQQS